MILELLPKSKESIGQYRWTFIELLLAIACGSLVIYVTFQALESILMMVVYYG